MSLFDLRNLFNVDPFLLQNFFRKPGIQYFPCNLSGRLSQAHDQYIRVVPPACPARRFSVTAQCRSDPPYLVCGDRRSCKYVFSSLATAIFIASPPSELIRILLNAAMQIERQKYLGAGPYERLEERQGYANEYKPKSVKTGLGEVTFDIPQVREVGFYPGALEKGLHSERALNLTLAEMHVQSVFTRKVKAAMEQLCGPRFPLPKSVVPRPNWM
jgi:hypothetical protein